MTEYSDARASNSVRGERVSVVVPTFNEAPNIERLVERIAGATDGRVGEIIFVDDSRDNTPEVIARVAETSEIPVRLIHREEAIGGLGGAVALGLAEAANAVCIVMDGDLQHPPERIREMTERYDKGDADVVVASRYVGGGSAGGLSDRVRVAVSRMSTLVTKSMFPIRLRGTTDPMTGFFLVNTARIRLDRLRPRGFKILLEILARHNLRVHEVPFDFAQRGGGASKASLTQGIRFIAQLSALRFGRMSAFAVIGGLGAIANLTIMWSLTALGIDYLIAAIIAAEVTIIGNFLLIEHFVYRDMRDQAAGGWRRFFTSFTFNNLEALVRIPIIGLMVESWHYSSIVAAAITLFVAFIVRFVFHSLVVYRPRSARPHEQEAL